MLIIDLHCLQHYPTLYNIFLFSPFTLFLICSPSSLPLQFHSPLVNTSSPRCPPTTYLPQLYKLIIFIVIPFYSHLSFCRFVELSVNMLVRLLSCCPFLSAIVCPCASLFILHCPSLSVCPSLSFVWLPVFLFASLY